MLRRQVSITEMPASSAHKQRVKMASSRGKAARSSKVLTKRVGAGRVEGVSTSDLKQVSIAVTGAAVSTSAITLLTGVGEGNTFADRDGRKVKARSLMLRGSFEQNTALGDDGAFRVIVFIDKVSNGAAPSIAQLLRTGTLISDPVNTDNLDRFIILKDEIIAFRYYEIGGADSVPIKWYFPLKDMPLSYIGTTAAQGAAGTNHVYCAVIADSNTAVSSSVYTDFRFVDI